MRPWQYLAVLLVLGTMALAKGPPPKEPSKLQWTFTDEDHVFVPKVSPPVITITRGTTTPIDFVGFSKIEPAFFTLMRNDGVKLVEINLKTGETKLHGDANDAAKRFWEAVGTMVPCR